MLKDIFFGVIQGIVWAVEIAILLIVIGWFGHIAFNLLLFGWNFVDKIS